MKKFDELVMGAPQVGRIEWIGLRPKYMSPLEGVELAEAVVDRGLIGDHYAETGGSDRQVTLIQHEHFAVMSGILNRKVEPGQTRRNVVVSGLNLSVLKKAKFQVGNVVMQATGNCAPCSRMEANLGPGGYAAMVGHGGITARILIGGTIRVGDSVSILSDSPA